MFNKFTAISTPPNHTSRSDRIPLTPLETPLIKNAMVSDNQDIVQYIHVLFDSLMTINNVLSSYKDNSDALAPFKSLWDTLRSGLPDLLSPLIDIFNNALSLSEQSGSNDKFSNRLPKPQEIKQRIGQLESDFKKMKSTVGTQPAPIKPPSDTSTLPLLYFESIPHLVSSNQDVLNYMQRNIEWLLNIKSAQKYSSTAQIQLDPLWENLQLSLTSLLPPIIEIHKEVLSLSNQNDSQQGFFTALSTQFGQPPQSASEFQMGLQMEIEFLERDLGHLTQKSTKFSIRISKHKPHRCDF